MPKERVTAGESTQAWAGIAIAAGVLALVSYSCSVVFKPFPWAMGRLLFFSFGPLSIISVAGHAVHRSRQPDSTSRGSGDPRTPGTDPLGRQCRAVWPRRLLGYLRFSRHDLPGHQPDSASGLREDLEYDGRTRFRSGSCPEPRDLPDGTGRSRLGELGPAVGAWYGVTLLLLLKCVLRSDRESAVAVHNETA